MGIAFGLGVYKSITDIRGAPWTDKVLESVPGNAMLLVHETMLWVSRPSRVSPNLLMLYMRKFWLTGIVTSAETHSKMSRFLVWRLPYHTSHCLLVSLSCDSPHPSVTTIQRRYSVSWGSLQMEENLRTHKCWILGEI